MTEPDLPTKATEVDPDDPTALFAKGLYGLFEPLVLELNDHIKNVFASQENLSAQLDHLTSELDRFNLTRAPPLDPHIERLQSLRKRMGVLSSHLDKVYNRLEKMNRAYGNYRQQSTAPPLRTNQPASQLRAPFTTEPTATPPLTTTIYRPQDPMALPSPYRQLVNSDTPVTDDDAGTASPPPSEVIESSTATGGALQPVWTAEPVAAVESASPLVEAQQEVNESTRTTADDNTDEAASEAGQVQDSQLEQAEQPVVAAGEAVDLSEAHEVEEEAEEAEPEPSSPTSAEQQPTVLNDDDDEEEEEEKEEEEDREGGEEGE